MAHGLAGLVSALLAGFRHHALLYAVLVAMYAVAFLASVTAGVDLSQMNLLMAIFFVALSEVAILIVAFFIHATRILGAGTSEGSVAIAAARRLGVHIFMPRNFSNAVHGSIFVAFFLAAFLFIKGMIPMIVPFRWDDTFADLDRTLHFGYQPFEWLLPVFGHEWFLSILGFIYSLLWMGTLLAFLFFQVLRSQNDGLRLRNLLAFGLTWFIGTNLLGGVFMSAGPCYYGYIIDGTDPFAPLMAALNAANERMPVLSLEGQKMLWQGYLGRMTGDNRGVISAMPSMHVATVVLFMFMFRGWRFWVATAYAVLIGLGSVLLGWHYAVDGYAGAALAVLCWYAAGSLVRKDLALQNRISAPEAVLAAT